MDGKIIGVDFSGHVISMAVVTFTRGERRMEAFEQVFLADENQWGGIAEAIAGIQQKIDISEALCIVSFPDEWIYHRIITMPFSDRKKINRIIAYEVEPLMPFAPGDMIIDFQRLASSQTADTGMDFLAAVASRTRLKNFIEKMNTVGLEPEIITSRGFAIASTLSAYRKDGLFLDGNDQRLVAGGIGGGNIRFVCSFNVGRQDKDRAQALVDAVNHILIADEERQQFDFKPDAVYIANHLYNLAGMKEAVESSLGIKAERMDIAALSSLNPAGLPDNTGQAGGFDAVLCLTMLKQVNRPFINFRKDEFAVTGKWRQYRDVIMKTGVIAALVIVMGLTSFFYDLQNARKRIAAMDARIVGVFKENFPDIPIIDDPLRQMRVELERLKGKGGLPPEMDRKACCIEILNDISRLVPPDIDVIIERLVAGPDDVILSGSTDSFNAVDALKNEFGKSDFFGKIDISSATMNKIDKRVIFKLRLELL